LHFVKTFPPGARASDFGASCPNAGAPSGQLDHLDAFHHANPSRSSFFLRRHDAERVKIVPGTLGDNAGALGAVVLARKRLKK